MTAAESPKPQSRAEHPIACIAPKETAVSDDITPVAETTKTSEFMAVMQQAKAAAADSSTSASVGLEGILNDSPRFGPSSSHDSLKGNEIDSADSVRRRIKAIADRRGGILQRLDLGKVVTGKPPVAPKNRPNNQTSSWNTSGEKLETKDSSGEPKKPATIDVSPGDPKCWQK